MIGTHVVRYGTVIHRGIATGVYGYLLSLIEAIDHPLGIDDLYLPANQLIRHAVIVLVF
jgi:hypothetical protein